MHSTTVMPWQVPSTASLTEPICSVTQLIVTLVFCILCHQARAWWQARAEVRTEENRDLLHRDWCVQRALAYKETIHRMKHTPWPAKTDPVFAAATEQYKTEIDELMSKIPHEIRTLM